MKIRAKTRRRRSSSPLPSPSSARLQIEALRGGVRKSGRKIGQVARGMQTARSSSQAPPWKNVMDRGRKILPLAFRAGLIASNFLTASSVDPGMSVGDREWTTGSGKQGVEGREWTAGSGRQDAPCIGSRTAKRTESGRRFRATRVVESSLGPESASIPASPPTSHDGARVHEISRNEHRGTRRRLENL